MSDTAYLYRRLPSRFPPVDPEEYIFNGQASGHRHMCIADALSGLIPRWPCEYCFTEQHTLYGATADWPERWLDDAQMAALFPDLNGSFDFYQRGARIVHALKVNFCVDDLGYVCFTCFQWQGCGEFTYDTDWSARWLEV